MLEPSIIEIDLSAIAHNMRVLQSAVGTGVGVCPVVKANAYGLGAARIVKRLAASRATMLAVYGPEQAAEIERECGRIPILVMRPVWTADELKAVYTPLQAGRIILSVHGPDHALELDRIATRLGARIGVHVEVDTGISRGGCPLDEARETLTRLAESRWLTAVGMYTHFADAEGDAGLCDQQLAEFRSLMSACRNLLPKSCVTHAANTAATVRSQRFHLNMVRIGLAWAGYVSMRRAAGNAAKLAAKLQHSVTWASRIVHLKEVEAETRIGYGGSWSATRATRIALAPVGYADGYPSTLRGDRKRPRAFVTLRRPAPVAADEAFAAPIIGAINMDQITVDVTDVPADVCRIGARVELISHDPAAPNALPQVAREAGILPHELLSRLNPRVRRSYFVRPAEVEDLPSSSMREIALPRPEEKIPANS